MLRLENRTLRLRKIEEVLLLNPNGMRVTELAARLDVTRRTVYRDLDFLSANGLPLWQTNGRFGIIRSHYLASIRLTLQEGVALVLAGLLLSRTIDERNPHVIAALRKLAVTMPTTLSKHLERAAKRVQTRTTGARQVSVLEAIAEGWCTGCKVQVGYRSPRSGVLRDRTIAPYALEPSPSGIYVLGHDDWADDLRTFKLERLEHATVLENSYAIPNDFNLDEHLATSWGIMTGPRLTEVVLRFAPTATAFVQERRWHPSQTLERKQDGSCLLKVKVTEPVEMQPWIRSWGAQVEVLEPAWLREQIAAELQQAAAQYSNEE